MLRKLSIGVLALALAFAGVAAGLATISSSLNKVIVAGNASQTVFSFPFVGVAAADISVTFTDATGASSVLANGPGPTQYQLALNAAVAPALWGIGGTVTYNPSGTPIASGTTLTILRTLPYVQLTTLQNQASFGQLAQATEKALDQLAMQTQQVSEAVTRVVQAPASDPAGINLTLPPAAQRANTGMAFDGSGNVIAGTTPAAGTISSAMQPVVNAASLSAGRTALGLGSMSQENINGGTCGGASIQDDGSAGGANGVGYARVVLGTVADATNQSVICAFHLQQRIATGPITYTLARANTLFNGFGFWIVDVSGVVTLLPNASDNIQLGGLAVASGTSILIPAGTTAFVTTNAASSGVWYVRLFAAGKEPTRQNLNSGSSATYTTPSGATRLFVRECGAGGGSGGTGAGGVGGTTSFNSITAIGGSGGGTTSTLAPGNGGTGGSGGATFRQAGNNGGRGSLFTNTGSVNITLNFPGGFGGAGPFGAGTTSDAAGVANSCGGASGPSGSGSASFGTGGGGGAGEYVEIIINNPAATYVYTVGAGGTAGTGGGFAGGSALIMVDEFYNFILKRDLDPASNDNTPAWLAAVA